jgi:hypothetical protein
MEEELESLNESIREYRWGLANIVVALICVAISGSQFVMGYIKGGFIVIAIRAPVKIYYASRSVYDLMAV